MAVDAALLEGIALFRSLDANDRSALAAVMAERRVERGSVLFHEAEPGDSLLCVVSGELETLVKDIAGQEIVLTSISAGDAVGEMSLLDGRPRSATVRCTEEARLLVLERDDFLTVLRRTPDMALDIMAQMAARARKVDDLLRSRVARNVNEEVAEISTPLERAADFIAAFAGSMWFLAVHIIWFTWWIAWNTIGARHFDPFPFGLLTMVVSLEAIFLSVFVLLSQNRQAAKDRVRSDIEYEVNVKAEMEVGNLHEKLDRMHEYVAGQLRRMERALGPRGGPAA
jgi:CRP/FNR family transcriptional regulator, cyclic AMP receptor protein